MTANPFEWTLPAPAAMWRNRFAQALVATLLLSGLLVIAIDILALYLTHPEVLPTDDPEYDEDKYWYLPKYDFYYFLSIAANQLSYLLLIGLSGWLIIQYLFERTGRVGYRRPRPVLITLLLVSLGFSLVFSVLMRFAWVYFFDWVNALELRFDAVSGLTTLLGAVNYVATWAVSVALPIWLSLHLFRSDALAGPPRQVGRNEAAWLAALCVGVGTLVLLRLFAKPFNFLGDLQTFASYYGIGIAVTLAAFVGARMALPARLDELRPQDLLAASLVNVASLALLIGGAAFMLMVISYGRPPINTWLVVLGVVSLPLCALMQLFCIKVIYRPVAV